jgi:hypothetical protein
MQKLLGDSSFLHGNKLRVDPFHLRGLRLLHSGICPSATAGYRKYHTTASRVWARGKAGWAGTYAEKAPGRTEIKPKTDSNGYHQLLFIWIRTTKLKYLIKDIWHLPISSFHAGREFSADLVFEILSCDNRVEEILSERSGICEDLSTSSSDIWVFLETLV